MPTRLKKVALALTVTAALLVVAAPASAGRGNGGGGSTSGGGSGSLTLVPLYTHTGGPVIGDWVTFTVSTSVTYPYVKVACTQGGTLVYSQTDGFFPSYPWGQNFQLGPTSSWASGSASCVATLFTTNSKGGSTTLATTSFAVSG